MRKLLWLTPAFGAAALSAAFLSSATSAPDNKAELRGVQTLPVSRVILFSSGVGHFARSGDVEGDARVDLTFPEQDVNDLIKSMVLQDFSDKGRVSAVTYDSHDPIDRTLQSFAINLNNNPSFSNILTQARGEKVEVALQQAAVGQPANITGSIIGVESQKQPAQGGAVDVSVLNLWCAEGVRSVKLGDIQRLRFSNPIIENEFRRALETLALSHDAQKKAVSLHFAGEGKRKVEVSYVIENPIWKTSYRLVLGKEGKPFLQGWAVVENPTDEDWSQVAMALISGRPISFRMDLYNPLYVPRPTVEPELFASLRPPTYSGALAGGKLSGSPDVAAATAPPPPAKKGAAARGGFGGGGPGGGAMPKGEAAKLDDGFDGARLRRTAEAEADREARAEFARGVANQLAGRMDLGRGVGSVATASQLGDYFQYVIDVPVSLGRQKSALLPIVNKDVEGQRVSIYNPAVQAKHPLLGLKFKNTSGLHLAQGPITVFEGSTYAGDSRVLDLQPNEERLLSYAVDLGTEVSVKPGNNTSRITKVRANKGIVFTETLIREERVYDIANRSQTDRTLLIEHPNRKGQGFTFVGTNKPAEEAADVFRFETKVAAGKSSNYTITEERSQGQNFVLTNAPDNQIRYFISLKEASEGLKGKLTEALSIKGKWDATRRDIGNVERRIQTITQDQNRLRQNLREMPKEAEAYKTYLKKFDDQEKEMDTLHTKLKTLQTQEETERKNYEDYLSNLTIE